MKWKNRLTNYNFWISIVSAVLLILQNFNVQFDISNFNEIVTAVLGLLVVIGIINDPTKSTAEQKTEKSEIKQSNNSKLEQVDNEAISNAENNLIDKIVEISNKVDLIAEDEKKDKIILSEDLKTESIKQEEPSYLEQDSNKNNEDSVVVTKELDNAEKDIESEKVVCENQTTPIDTQTENVANIVETTDKVFVTGKGLFEANINTEQMCKEIINVNSEGSSGLPETETGLEYFV